MPTAYVNQLQLYYESHGSGPPLILINGLGSSTATWDTALVEGLSRHHQTIVFDNRGTGRSDKPDNPYTISHFAQDVGGLLDVLGIARAHVLGASMGGMIAQQFALDHSQRIERLVLCCTTAGGPEATPPSMETLGAIANVDAWSPREMLRRNRRLAFLPEFIRANESYLDTKLDREVVFPTPLTSLAHHATAAFTFNVYDRLQEIEHRTLVMVGREDLMVPMPNSVLLARRIPNADLLVFANAGHGFITEKTAACVKAICRFLGD